MVSIPFEKVSRELLSTTTKQVQTRTNLNLTNMNKGIYPLYKMSIGITEQDRIIGIDPGMYIILTINMFVFRN